jgi:hypothetical protein
VHRSSFIVYIRDIDSAVLRVLNNANSFNRKKIAIGFTAIQLGSLMFQGGVLRILRSLKCLFPILLSGGKVLQYVASRNVTP